MNILVIASEVPPTRSGVARTVGLLESGLRKRGHDVVLVSGAGRRRLTVGEFRVSGFAARWPSLLRQLRACDVVNVHGPVPTVSDVFFLLLETVPRPRRPAVVYTHHSSIEIAGLTWACRAYNEFHGRIVGRADHAVVSTESYRRVLEAGTAVPISVVPWGVDTAKFRHSRVRRRAHEPLRVLFVGQMRPYKGIDILLRAVSGCPELRLTLAGWGRLGERYRRACASRGDVCFVGAVPDDRLAWLYASHDVVALPSVTEAEAYGLVLVEGMAAGCVPVASDLPGVRDVAGPTGLLARPGDVEALRRQLLRLAHEPELLERLSWASRERARSLTDASVVDRYEEVLTAAVQARRGPVVRTVPEVELLRDLDPSRRRRERIGALPRAEEDKAAPDLQVGAGAEAGLTQAP